MGVLLPMSAGMDSKRVQIETMRAFFSWAACSLLAFLGTSPPVPPTFLRMAAMILEVASCQRCI